MKKQIRRGTFETNSSSTHSLTFCMADEFEKFENGEILYDDDNDSFITIEEAKKDWLETGSDEKTYPFKDYLQDEGIKTFEEWEDDEDLETFVNTYKTPQGEEVVAFGKFGYKG